MFKTVNAYSIGPGWYTKIQQIGEALEPLRFAECGPTQEKSLGWVEPRGEKNGALVESVSGQLIMKLRIDTKAVPASVIKNKMQDVIKKIEDEVGHKPGRKQQKELAEEIRLSLLPVAFPSESFVLVWINPINRMLVIDASSQSKADDVATALVTAMPGMILTPLQLQAATSPQVAMTQWLKAATPDEWPTRFSIEKGGELKGQDEEKAAIKFTHHTLLTDEVRQHIAQGKLPTQLDMSWDGRVAFTLTDTLQLKKISFLEGVFDATPAQKADGFDADVAIATGELRGLLRDLMDALGGEK